MMEAKLASNPDLHSLCINTIRTLSTEVVPSKIDHWAAEPLDDTIPRILGLDLSSRLGTHRMVFYPWYRGEEPDDQVVVAQRFERDNDGNAALVARFEVRGLRGAPRTLFRETSRRGRQRRPTLRRWPRR